MSMLLMAKAMQLQVGSTAQKMVLLKLADNANDKGECFPSYETIARHCEISRQSAINHIKSLCKKGLFVKLREKLIRCILPIYIFWIWRLNLLMTVVKIQYHLVKILYQR
ncbi:helix-turn-helix domain-containing protein [Proteus mirabilis]